MPKRATGRYERTTVGGGEVAAFVPHALPPADPPGSSTPPWPSASGPLSKRSFAWSWLGRWSPRSTGSSTRSSAKRPCSRRRSKGHRRTLVDLLTFEAQQSAAPNADVQEVCNYLDALAYARAQLADPKGLPLSMRLLSETHSRLMRGVAKLRE